MKIKHSKFKNTGLIYELLVKQITSDLVSRKESPAVNIFRKYFSGNNALLQEYGLYRAISEGVNLTPIRANELINATLRVSRRINLKELKELKYNLISEIKESYSLDAFFATPVVNYKSLAAFYCLLEVDRSSDLVDPHSIVSNKATLLEYMTSRLQAEEDVKDSLIKEFSSQEKDLRMLTFKVLLEKFNEKYADLLPEQKNILRHVISSRSVQSLKDFLNEEMSAVSKQLTEYSSKLPDCIEKIKINEAIKMLEPILPSENLSDTQLVRILQFYDLLEELKKV